MAPKVIASLSEPPMTVSMFLRVPVLATLANVSESLPPARSIDVRASKSRSERNRVGSSAPVIVSTLETVTLLAALARMSVVIGAAEIHGAGRDPRECNRCRLPRRRSTVSTLAKRRVLAPAPTGSVVCASGQIDRAARDS